MSPPANNRLAPLHVPVKTTKTNAEHITKTLSLVQSDACKVDSPCCEENTHWNRLIPKKCRINKHKKSQKSTL